MFDYIRKLRCIYSDCIKFSLFKFKIKFTATASSDTQVLLLIKALFLSSSYCDDVIKKMFNPIKWSYAP